jgi:tRNA(fMet)-specific endonuclease VapC
MVVLDTDLLSLLQFEKSAASETLVSRLARLDPQEITTTIVTYEEQTRGWLAYRARSKGILREIVAYRRLKKHLDDYRSLIVLEFDDRAAGEFQRLQRLGIRIGTMDLRIAAIAIQNRARLLTRNLADFKRAPGLRVEDWTC